MVVSIKSVDMSFDEVTPHIFARECIRKFQLLIFLVRQQGLSRISSFLFYCYYYYYFLNLIYLFNFFFFFFLFGETFLWVLRNVPIFIAFVTFHHISLLNMVPKLALD